MSDPNDRQGSPGESRGTETPVAAGADLIIPALAVGLALYFITTTIDLTREARLTGWMIGFLLIALCIAQGMTVALGLRRGTVSMRLGELAENTANNRRRLALVGMMVLFIALIDVVGTTPGLFLTVLGGLLVMGVRKPSQLFGIAGGTAITVFVLFILTLGSRLPRGPFEDFMVPLLTGLGG